jgi:hypothetical protein
LHICCIEKVRLHRISFWLVHLVPSLSYSPSTFLPQFVLLRYHFSSDLSFFLALAKQRRSSKKLLEDGRGSFVKGLFGVWFGISIITNQHHLNPQSASSPQPSKDEVHNSPLKLLNISNNLPKHILISLLRNLALTRVLLTTIKSVRSMTIKIGCPIPFFAVTVRRTDDIVVGEIGVVEEGEVFWVCVSEGEWTGRGGKGYLL